MPCNSDYLNPTGTELESVRVSKLLVYFYGKLQKEVPKWIEKAANHSYGNVDRLDEATKILCENCRSLTKKETEDFIYNAHNKQSRDLAAWWERHQEWDTRRVEEEEDTRKKVLAKKSALRKLTSDEIEALGI